MLAFRRGSNGSSVVGHFHRVKISRIRLTKVCRVFQIFASR
ncbi:Uncharacterised protein [Vibrio cholerae]|nr:Uncharacterised protein [Vibrio cholerae]